MTGPAREILIVADDPIIATSLAMLAADLGAEVRVVRTVAESATSPAEPLVVIADIAQEGAISAAVVWRARWPGALLAGSIAMPRRELWDAALAAGFDVVTNRGALPARLRARLATWSGPPAGVRLRLLDVADVAGRLGVVARIADSPAGPLAVYHVGGRLFVARDVCPHAGARLSTGELDGAVVTCPLHGSQFDVRTGERLRGPADDSLETFPVVTESGVAYADLGVRAS